MIRKFQTQFMRSVDETGAAFDSEGDEDFQLDDDGNIIFPEEVELISQPTEEELAATAATQAEEREARIAARALALHEESKSKEKVKDEPASEPIQAGDPDEDIFAKLAVATDNVTIAKLNRELHNRQYFRNQQSANTQQTLSDKLADEYSGDDPGARKWLKAQLSSLPTHILEQVSRNPSELEKIELMAEGYRAKQARHAPAAPPRSEGSNQPALTTTFSAYDEQQIALAIRSFGWSRKEAEHEYKKSLRG